MEGDRVGKPDGAYLEIGGADSAPDARTDASPGADASAPPNYLEVPVPAASVQTAASTDARRLVTTPADDVKIVAALANDELPLLAALWPTVRDLAGALPTAADLEARLDVARNVLNAVTRRGAEWRARAEIAGTALNRRLAALKAVPDTTVHGAACAEHAAWLSRVIESAARALAGDEWMLSARDARRLFDDARARGMPAGQVREICARCGIEVLATESPVWTELAALPGSPRTLDAVADVLVKMQSQALVAIRDGAIGSWLRDNRASEELQESAREAQRLAARPETASLALWTQVWSLGRAGFLIGGIEIDAPESLLAMLRGARLHDSQIEVVAPTLALWFQRRGLGPAVSACDAIARRDAHAHARLRWALGEPFRLAGKTVADAAAFARETLMREPARIAGLEYFRDGTLVAWLESLPLARRDARWIDDLSRARETAVGTDEIAFWRGIYRHAPRASLRAPVGNDRFVRFASAAELLVTAHVAAAWEPLKAMFHTGEMLGWLEVAAPGLQLDVSRTVANDDRELNALLWGIGHTGLVIPWGRRGLVVTTTADLVTAYQKSWQQLESQFARGFIAEYLTRFHGTTRIAGIALGEAVTALMDEATRLPAGYVALRLALLCGLDYLPLDPKQPRDAATLRGYSHLDRGRSEPDAWSALQSHVRAGTALLWAARQARELGPVLASTLGTGAELSHEALVEQLASVGVPVPSSALGTELTAAKREADRVTQREETGLASLREAERESTRLAALRAEEQQVARAVAARALEEEAKRVATLKLAEQDAIRAATERLARLDAARAVTLHAAEQEVLRLSALRVTEQANAQVAAMRAQHEEQARVQAALEAEAAAQRVAAALVAEQEAERAAAAIAAEQAMARAAASLAAEQEIAQATAALAVAQEHGALVAREFAEQEAARVARALAEEQRRVASLARDAAERTAGEIAASLAASVPPASAAFEGTVLDGAADDLSLTLESRDDLDRLEELGPGSSAADVLGDGDIFALPERHDIAAAMLIESEAITDAATLERLRAVISGWARSQGAHPFQDLGDVVQSVEATLSPAFSVAVHTRLESRRIEVVREPWRSRDVLAVTGPSEQADAWDVALPDVDTWSDWRAQYDIAASAALRECSQCHGKTKVACDKCAGAGTRDCANCGATTRARCARCAGTGQQVGDRGTVRRCEHCDGRGEQRCRECHGGKVSCVRCDGAAMRTCSGCEGRGERTERFGLTQDYAVVAAMGTVSGAVPAALLNEAHNEALGPIPVAHLEGPEIDPFLIAREIPNPVLGSYIAELLTQESKRAENGARVTRQRLLVRRYPAYRVRYQHGGAAYELWVHGTHERVFAESTPISRHLDGLASAARAALAGEDLQSAIDALVKLMEIDAQHAEGRIVARELGDAVLALARGGDPTLARDLATRAARVRWSECVSRLVEAERHLAHRLGKASPWLLAEQARTALTASRYDRCIDRLVEISKLDSNNSEGRAIAISLGETAVALARGGRLLAARDLATRMQRLPWEEARNPSRDAAGIVGATLRAGVMRRLVPAIALALTSMSLLVLLTSRIAMVPVALALAMAAQAGGSRWLLGPQLAQTADADVLGRRAVLVASVPALVVGLVIAVLGRM